MSSGPKADPALIEKLLSLPERDQRTRLLRAKGLLNDEGLDRLLDFAEKSLGDDPGKARRLSELCMDLAEPAKAPAAVPRANYIRAGVHNINGEFEEDLRLTKVAHDGYVALGMNLEALRTNVGRMAALLELGRYQEALDVSQTVLDALDGKAEFEVVPERSQARFLGALVHQNRGACYELTGRYEEALDAYASAEECYRTLDTKERLGEIRDNRGRILSYLGRGSEALASQEAAAAIFRETGLALSHTRALVNIGETHLRLGNYKLSLETFEQARRLLERLNALADKYLLLRHTADAYLELNLYSEALTVYREADDLLRASGMRHDHAQALWGMGSALIARTEFDEAEKVLTEAETLFEAAGNLPLLSGVMLERASLLDSRGEREQALTLASQALKLVSKGDWPVQAFYARLRLADLLLPGVDDVEPHLREAEKLIGRLALPHLRYRLNERLGRLRRLQGQDEDARRLLEEAVGEIERLRGGVAQDSMRASFLRDKVAAYEELLRIYLSRDDAESARRAFSVAERAKSRALVDLLTGVAEKGAAGDPDLDARLRALQGDLNAVYNEMLDAPEEDGPRVPLSRLQARAAELEQEISRLRLHAAAAGSTSELFAEPMPPDVIQARLPEDVTLLSYHLVGDEVMAFVNVGGHIRVARNLSTVQKVRRLSQKLAFQWNRFRVGREFVERNMPVLEKSARQVLAALYRELVGPLEPILEEAEGPVPKLAVVPHGLLHRVPFHALFDGERYLIERFEISYAPSATVYDLCQRRDPRGPEGALVLGVEDPSIPVASGEARAVAERLPGARVRTGEEATLEALRSEAPGRGVLHLACHGLFRADNPMFSALKLHDGWLMASDAMLLDLDGALVTLSACESGRSEVIGGDEVIGLTRAFLGAGAATLVVSLWLVQDDTTAELMSRWYETLGGGKGRTAALRAAQLEIKERHPHPYYWAPFVLMGKR